jgi:hypothetical protein
MTHNQALNQLVASLPLVSAGVSGSKTWTLRSIPK